MRLLVVNVAWSVLLGAGIFFTSPKFLDVIESFDMPLSGLTTLALSPAFRYLVPFLAIIFLAKERTFRSPQTNFWLNFVHTILIFGIQAIYIACVFGPLFQILDRLAFVPNAKYFASLH